MKTTDDSVLQYKRANYETTRPWWEWQAAEQSTHLVRTTTTDWADVWWTREKRVRQQHAPPLKKRRPRSLCAVWCPALSLCITCSLRLRCMAYIHKRPWLANRRDSITEAQPGPPGTKTALASEGKYCHPVVDGRQRPNTDFLMQSHLVRWLNKRCIDYVMSMQKVCVGHNVLKTI